MKISASQDWTRREFLTCGSFYSMAGLLSLQGTAGVAIHLAGYAGSGELPEGAGGRLGCGIIGLGSRGREVAAVLSRIERARVVALCATIPQR